MLPIRNETQRRGKPAVTCLLVLTNVALFAYLLFLAPGGRQELVDRCGLIPARLWSLPASVHPRDLAWSVAPLLTSMFLHGGLLHLLGNALSLWIFGPGVEDRLGHVRFLAFYAATGVAAGLMHAVLHVRSPVPTIGASGAIAGVMGAYFLLFPFSWITVVVPVLVFPVPLKLPAVVYLLFWIATQLAGVYYGLGVRTGIAFWAHIGGFAAGVWLIRKHRRVRRRGGGRGR